MADAPFDGYKRHDTVRPGLYVPGDPRTTNYMEMLWRLADAAAGLPAHQRPDRMYLSATDYGAVVEELRAQHGASKTEAPGYLIFGKKATFKVLNAGTDDMATVNRMNRDTPGAVDFKARLKQFVPANA
jgi:hypothetical protein